MLPGLRMNPAAKTLFIQGLHALDKTRGLFSELWTPRSQCAASTCKFSFIQELRP